MSFVAHGSGYMLALTPTEAVLMLAHGLVAVAPRDHITLPGQPSLTPQPTTPPTFVGMQWLGANPHPAITGENLLPGTVNYFVGNDPKQWHTNIPTYQQVRYHNVYPGVDLVYYGNAGQLEYDFVVAPGADPAAIQLTFTGAQGVGLDLSGNLQLSLPGGPIAQEKPLVYQTIHGAQHVLAGGFTLTASQRVGFVLGAYDSHLPLVIDPAYRFSTYLGGSDIDIGNGVAVDTSGNAYITGRTLSSNFPVTPGAYQTRGGFGSSSAFVSKLNASGSALVYSTYFGSSNSVYGNEGTAIAVDSSGDAYFTGLAIQYSNFPTTPGAFQTTYGGGDMNAVVTELNPAGSALVYSTYLSGSGSEYGTGISVDASDDAYVTGYAGSLNFPVTPGALQTTSGTYGDAFVSKLNASGNALVYSTYFGGNGNGPVQTTGIAVDSSGRAYLTGNAQSNGLPTVNAIQTAMHGHEDAFVSELNTTGSALVYSTYLGGSGYDQGFAIAVDGGGNAYVTGNTISTDFPVTSGAFQTHMIGTSGNAFVTKFTTTGRLVYSTYLGDGGGGRTGEIGYGIAVDANGDAVLTGTTQSPNFPLVNPLQTTLRSSVGDGFVTRFNASGSALLFSTFLGGSVQDQGQAIALGVGGNVYVTGYTASSDFPTTNALYSTYNGGADDAFVTKILMLPSIDTTTGVFRPSTGVLYLKNANSTGPADITLSYGQPGDVPVTGDWIGQGFHTIGVYRNGIFYLRDSNTTGPADQVIPFGQAGDIPMVGDWTGKGYDSIGVYRPSTATFYLRNFNLPGPPDLIAAFGATGDVPIVGDWTGKGYDSVGVFRPSTGSVYLRNSNTTGPADISFTYGVAGDQPVVGDWNADGVDTLGVDRGGHFLLRNANTTGPADISFYLGASADNPIAGPWLAPVGGALPSLRGPTAPQRVSPAGPLTARRTSAQQ